MSGSRFDDLSKTLAGETSRRGILKALVGGLAALVTGAAVAPQSSEAQTGSCYPTQPCIYNQQATQLSLAFCQANFPSQGPPGTMTAGCCQALAPCSQGPAFQCGPGAPPGSPAICAGACCPANAPGCCANVCTPLNTVQNCGTCGNACPTGSGCCGGTCRPLNTAQNCGACGVACPGNQGCCNGTCTALNTPNNCGTCGTVCPTPANATANCTNSVCGFTCNTGFNLCNGQCVNLLTDPNNCGKCGIVCPNGQTCSNSTCTGGAGSFSCPSSDLAGFPLGPGSNTGNPLFCSYPAFTGEDPNDFFCTYSVTTGALITDNDAGFCPGTASSAARPFVRPNIPPPAPGSKIKGGH